MSSRTRLALILFGTFLTVSAIVAFTIARLRYWETAGSAGFSYMPPGPKAEKQPKVLFGLSPGIVVVAYPGGAAEAAGIHARDTVVAINGFDIADFAALDALAKRVHTGDTVVYRIKRGTAVRDVPVRFRSPLRNPAYIISGVVATIVAAAFIGIGLLVFTRQRNDRSVPVFYAAVMVGALSLMASPAIALDASGLRGFVTGSQQNAVAMMALFATTFALLPLTLHLALVFPRERPVMHASPRILGWIYGIPVTTLLMFCAVVGVSALAQTGVERLKRGVDATNITFAVFTVAGLLLALRIARFGRDEGIRRAFWNRPIQSLIVFFAVVFGLGRIGIVLEWKWLLGLAAVLGLLVPFLALVSFPFLACVSLYRSYREAGAEERRQVKWPLWAIFTAVATKIVVFVIAQGVSISLLASGQDFSRWMKAMTHLPVLATITYLLIPISFAVAILKYRLMNIDLIIRKTVAYAILTGAIIVLYLVLVGGLGTVLVRFTGVKSQAMVIASTLVVAVIFVPLRNRLQTLVDRNLFRHKYDYPVALKAISGETLSASDIGAFLSSAAEKTQQALQNRAVVMFVDRHEEFVAAAKVGVADSLLGTLRVLHAPVLPLLDRPFDPRRRELPEDAAAALKRIEATLVVPINTPGTPANGFIAVAPKLSGAPFDIEDIDFLRAVADQLDLGIDRIRSQREEADFVQARAIQQTLLPREMPRVKGLDVSGVWQPARMMGGDYYDLLELSDTELAVCIGDVAGKGMPAALLMSGLQAAVRASASNSPRDLCERVRRVVVSSLSGGRFVTFFYATIDTAAMKLRWCNAGQNAPVLARADGSIVRLAEGGPAFSRLFRDATYEEREIGLTPGDRILLFTDGASEASDAAGELLGETRLEELVAEHRTLGAHALQEKIVDAALSFSGGELEDDLTLVVVAVTQPA